MAIATTSTATPRTRSSRAWTGALSPAFAISGAATVVAGSYMTWATFYAGLIQRNGVPGHGKYFIGLAAATIAVVALTGIRGVTPALRWFIPAAGIAIVATAARDLYNLNQLVGDPAAGFYVPGRGNGLPVVIAGGAIMALSVFASPSMPRFGDMDVRRTSFALAIVAAVVMLVPGLYGEYYLYFASGGHAHNHADTLNPAHVLTAGGTLATLVAVQIAITMLPRSASH